MTSIRVDLAGGPRIRNGDLTVAEGDIVGRRATLAFGMLVLERDRAVPREEIAELLWGERLPNSWAPSLREVMSKVRSFMARAGLPARESLTSAFGCYQLRLPEGTEVDIEIARLAVESAAEAAASGQHDLATTKALEAEAVLGRPFLPGLEADWLRAKRDELEGLLLRALQILTDARIDSGRADLAIESAERSVTLNPYSDSSYIRLMRAQVESGDRAEALRSYERYRRVMSEELGVGPSSDVEIEFRRLLDREVDPGDAREPPAQPSAGPVGREPELAELESKYRMVADGAGEVVSLVGTAGIGKSNMARRFGGLVNELGGTVLTGRCAEEGVRTFGPLIEALGTQAAEATRAFAEREPDERPEGISKYLEDRAADRPLLLIIEDVHWADPSTLNMILRWNAAGVPPRTLVLLTLRDDEPTRIEESEPLLERLLESEEGRIDLPPLDRKAVAQLAEEFGFPTRGIRGRALLDALLEETGGNPLHVIEVARHLEDGGLPDERASDWATRSPLGNLPVPPVLAGVVFSRFSRLPQATRELLEAGAVAGETFRLDDLGLTEAADDQTLLAALMPAIDAGVLTELDVETENLGFAHSVHRRVILDQVPTRRLRELHLRVATALERRDGTEPGVLADHWAEAGDARATGYAREAGSLAMSEVAYVEAISWFRVALEQSAVTDPANDRLRLELLLQLGIALKRSGEITQAESTFLEAAALARIAGDPAWLGEVAVEFAEFNRFAPVVTPDSAALIEEAIAGLGEGTDCELKVRLLARRAQFASATGDSATVEQATRTALGVAERIGERDAIIEAVAARLHALDGPDKASARLEAAERLLLETGDPSDIESRLRALEHRTWALAELGEDMEARASANRFCEQADLLRMPAVDLFAAQFRAYSTTLEGRFEDCERIADEVGLAASRTSDPRMSESSRVMILVPSRWLAGRFRTITKPIRAIAAWQPDLESMRAAAVLVELADGQVDLAVSMMRSLVEDGVLGTEDHGSFWPIDFFYHAVSAVELSDADAAAYVFERGRRFSGMNCTYRGMVYFGSYDHHLAALAAVAGMRTERDHFAERARARYEAISAVPWLERLDKTI